ncbi:MAG TPA: AI-2E family transporter [Terriglobales bacterium]|nr:AI-2E family transporter [Terriglobales bacterium]
MPDQVANKSAVAGQSQVGAVEMAPPSSASPSDMLLRRIAILLFILVAGLLTVFGYYASSICITVILAAFLAILIDPVVVTLEKLRLPRGLAAAVVVLAGMGLIALLGHALYGRAVAFTEELPEYTAKIQQAMEPISRKIEKVQQSAGSLTSDVQPIKKVPEVRLRESPSWPAYLVRGAGSVWGVLIIAGVVPFLTFFMLCSKDQMATRMNALFSSRMDSARFITTLNQMIRGFVAGNFIVGSVMAAATTLMLWGIGMRGAIPLGIASGLLNLVPFLGLIFSLALPLAAALLQFNTPAPFIVITLTILLLHVVSANLLIPKFIATRVSIGPVAATVGILFWGWLWGVMGLLLAVPLTALVKMVADLHPSLCHLSNMLALTPRPIPRWVRYGETIVGRAIPYLGGRPGMKSGGGV